MNLAHEPKFDDAARPFGLRKRQDRESEALNGSGGGRGSYFGIFCADLNIGERQKAQSTTFGSKRGFCICRLEIDS